VARRCYSRAHASQVTLLVEWMGGERQYRPAQLQKSEILAGISGLLSTILQESEELHLRHSNGTYAGDGLIPYAEDVSFHPVSVVHYAWLNFR